MLYIHADSSFYDLTYQPTMIAIKMYLYDHTYGAITYDQFGAYSAGSFVPVAMTSATCDGASTLATSIATVVVASALMQ